MQEWMYRGKEEGTGSSGERHKGNRLQEAAPR